MSDKTAKGAYDEAYDFVTYTDDKSVEETNTQLSKVYRKVDARVSAILCGIYFFQFLDKSLLNYAAVMGIKDNLKKDSNQFSNLGTILYVAYIACEPLAAFLFQKLPVAKFFGTCVFLWGVVIVLHVVTKTYASLMVIRALLGCFEASVAPGCILVTGMWYNKKQQLTRMGHWTIQAGTSTVVGGLLLFAFQHVDSKSTSLASWQIFFLVMGLLTVIFGVIVLVVLPDSPIKAKFLTHEEKLLVLENIRGNQTGTENKTFKRSQLREFLLEDKHTWPMFFLTVVSMVPTGAVLTFSVTIISSIGFSNKHAALMQMPLGVTTIIAIYFGTYLCAYFDGKHRNWVFISMLVPAIIGYIVLLTSHNKVGQLLAVYLINVGTCVITMIYSWNSANTAGFTKRLARNCLTMMAFAAGALIGPQLFRAQDAPQYRPAKITLLVLTAVCIPLVLLVSFISRQENRKRDAASELEVSKWESTHGGENYEFKDLTDVENIHFRYQY